MVIILALVFSIDLDLKEVLKQLNQPAYVLVALLIPLLVNPLISINRWQIFLSVQGIKESFVPLVQMYFSSMFLGVLLPSSTGYDAIRVYMIEKRHPEKRGIGTAAVFIERLLGFYLLSIVGVIGALWMVANGSAVWLLLIIGSVNLALLFLFILIFNRALFRRIIGLMYRFKKARRLRTFLFAAFTATHRFPLRQSLPVTVPLILLFQLSTIFITYLLFLAFGIDLPIYYHLAYMPVIQIISIVPLSVSGLGFREGAFVYFYGTIGVAAGISLTTSILYYLLLLLTPAVVGFGVYVFKPVAMKNVHIAHIQKKAP